MLLIIKIERVGYNPLGVYIIQAHTMLYIFIPTHTLMYHPQKSQKFEHDT